MREADKAISAECIPEQMLLSSVLLSASPSPRYSTFSLFPFRTTFSLESLEGIHEVCRWSAIIHANFKTLTTSRHGRGFVALFLSALSVFECSVRLLELDSNLTRNSTLTRNSLSLSFCRCFSLTRDPLVSTNMDRINILIHNNNS